MYVLPCTICFVIYPLSLVDITINMYKAALALRLSFVIVALVLRSIIPYINTSSRF